MKLFRPDRKSAARRLLVMHLAASLISSALILTAVYAGVMRLLETQTATLVETELRDLVENYIEGGQYSLRSAINRRVSSRSDADSVYLYASANKHPIVGNLSQWPDIPLNNEWNKVQLTRTDIDREVLVGLRALVLPNGGYLLVGRDLREQREFRDILTLASGAFLLFFLIFGSLGGLAVSRTILKRVNDIQQAASDTVHGDLSRRVALRGNGDEFDRLATSLNEMLAKNESLVSELRMVTDSLSHDLRTPLARMRSKLETAIANQSESSENTDLIEEALLEADYVHQVFSDLIDIARTEADLVQEQFETVNLTEVVIAAIELYAPLAEEKEQEITLEIHQNVLVIGHAQFLARALANLLDNAVKFTPIGGQISVSLRKMDAQAILMISDSGPGVSLSEWPLAVQRMGQLSKERKEPGAGLGLSLVSKVAVLHGTKLARVDSDTGLIVQIIFKTIPIERGE